MTPENPEEFAKLVFQAASEGKWLSLVALALIGIVWAVRKYGAPKVPFFATSEGGAIVNIVTSFVLALSGALLAGTPPTWGMAWVALQTSFLAAGGWSLVRNLLPFFARFVPWLGSGDASASIATAKKEGDAAASVAKPKTATDIVNGPPK